MDNSTQNFHLCQSTSCLAPYATAHLGHQFRVHNFCLLVSGEYARFIRWDRDGVTVTRHFDYIKEPHLLADFFWRYAHLYRSQHGYDTSVSSATPEDTEQIERSCEMTTIDMPISTVIFFIVTSVWVISHTRARAS